MSKHIQLQNYLLTQHIIKISCNFDVSSYYTQQHTGDSGINLLQDTGGTTPVFLMSTLQVFVFLRLTVNAPLVRTSLIWVTWTWTLVNVNVAL